MTPIHNSYWLNTAPRFDFTPTPLPTQTEIAILGAGIMGSSVAYWLARHEKRPLVLERNPHPAGGATGRNGGLMISGPNQPYHLAVQRLGRAAAREIMQTTLVNRELVEEILARESIQAGYARAGFLDIASNPERVQLQKATVLTMHADGFAAEWLDRAAAMEKLGTTLGPEYTGALFKPDEGQIHSARYAFGVAEAARRHGAQFAFSTSALTVEPGPHGRGWQIRTGRGTVVAEQLVVTLNAWAGDLFPELKRLIVPTRGHIVLTAPVSFKLTPWSANEGWDYGRQLESGQVLVGGQRISRPDRDMGYPPPPGENIPPVLPEVVSALTNIAPRLFPALADVPIVQHWTGTMAFTPDEQPLVGCWPGRAGLWLLVGLSGHGMPFSQALPCALAAQLAGEDGPTLPGAFDPARFLGH